MSKYLKYTVAIACVLALSGGSALAVNTTSSNTATTTKEVKAKTKAELAKELLKQAVKKSYDRIISNFTERLVWEQNLGMRIESRIVKMKQNGLNTTAAETKLTEAKTMWDAANTQLSGLAAKIESIMDTAKDNKTMKKDINAAVEEVRNNIKGVHAKFVEAVTLIKSAGSPSPVATTTKTTE